MAILRVSSWRQEGNNSHQVQEEKIKEYCKVNSLELVDDGIRKIVESAKRSDERKKYAECIASALRQDIFNILFYMGDRESRNLTDNEQNEHLVMDGKICLHYVNDNKILHKNSSASDFLMRDFSAVQNKNFSRVLSEKVNDVMRQKAENGWFPGNRPTLGYIHQKMRDSSGKETKRGTIIVIDPDEKNLIWVRREFELRFKGYTIEQIRDSLLQEGLVPASKVRTYSKHGVEERLKNKFYWGSFDWQGIEYKGNHPLIISKRILDGVKASFGIKGAYDRTKHLTAMFSGGWLKCAHPECHMQIVYDPKQKKIKSSGEIKRFDYYRCSNSRKIHEKLKYVSENKIWMQFEALINKVELSEDMANKISDALNKLTEKSKSNVKKDIAGYQLALEQIEEKKNKVFDLYLAGNLDQADYKKQNQRVLDEKGYYAHLLAQANSSMSDVWKLAAQNIFELAKSAKTLWKEGSVEQRMNILKALCSNPSLDGASIQYDLKKPFVTLEEMGQKEDWRSQRDSNSCILRERGIRLKHKQLKLLTFFDFLNNFNKLVF